MELAEILAEDSVIACPRVNDKRELLDIISRLAAKATSHTPEAIFETLEAREALGSTGLGNGIAIPHGKLDGLGRVTAVFVRLGEAVDFDAIDDQPVDLAIALFAPTGSGADHLKALARVARLLRTDALVESLRATDDPARLYALLTAPLAAQNAA